MQHETNVNYLNIQLNTERDFSWTKYETKPFQKQILKRKSIWSDAMLWVCVWSKSIEQMNAKCDYYWTITDAIKYVVCMNVWQKISNEKKNWIIF